MAVLYASHVPMELFENPSRVVNLRLQHKTQEETNRAAFGLPYNHHYHGMNGARIYFVGLS